MDGLAPEPPVSIAPYAVLEIERGATPAEVRTAYKKLALRYHPDKAAPADQGTAHTKFQEIAFAYAILSDPNRRARYDATGSTSDSLLGDDGDFNWTDFFRQQFSEAFTFDRFSRFKEEYQNSAKETSDLLATYTKTKGNMNAIFRTVMLSSVLDDEDRFRAIIDGAIARGEVEAYDAYVNESTKSRDLRRRRAERERKGAEKHAKKMGIYEKVFGADAEGKGSKKRKHEGDAQELEALVQQKAKARAATFLENLEAKYAGGAKGGKGKKGPGKKHEEPPEEAFQKTAARMNKRKARAPTPPQEESVDEDVTNDEDDEEEEVLDLTLDSPADEDDDDDDEEDTEPAEEEDVAPRKRRRMPQRKVPKRNITAKKAKGSKKR